MLLSFVIMVTDSVQPFPNKHQTVCFVLTSMKSDKQLKEDVHKSNSTRRQWATRYKRCKLIVVSGIFRENNKETVRPTWMQNKGSCFCDKTRKRRVTQTQKLSPDTCKYNSKLTGKMPH